MRPALRCVLYIYRNIVGPHRLGRKNHRGQMLINFCERNGLIVTNTRFRKLKRRLYTWKAPGDQSRHQLDYILVKHRFRNCGRCADTAWGRYRLGPQLTSCQDLHQIEENHKVPKEKTTMGFGEIAYSKTNSAGYSRRETRCN